MRHYVTVSTLSNFKENLTESTFSDAERENIDYALLADMLDNKVGSSSVGGGFITGVVPFADALIEKSMPVQKEISTALATNPDLEAGINASSYNPWQDIKDAAPGAFMAGQIVGNIALFEVGATGLKALSAATGIKALANPAVINSVTMSANTALNGIANGNSWDTVVINTVTSALSTATGTKVGNLVGSKVVSALNNLGLSERAVSALAASSNGVSFAVTQSALEETKNAFMYGAEYKPDAASIAANIITSILFGSLEAFKKNPKAAELQNRLKQGDVSAQKEAADFLNKQSQVDQSVLTAHEQAEQYINQWPKAQGVENKDVNGYNWDDIYKETVYGAGDGLNKLPKTTTGSVRTKLDTYLLEPTHPVGGNKARWFKEALGFTKDNSADLAKQIEFDPKKAVQTATNAHGTKFSQFISVQGANGKIIDVEFIFIKNNDGLIRLVTSIPTKR